MGGRRRYVKEMLNIPASRVGIKMKTPVVNKPKGKVAIPVKKTPTNFGASTMPKHIGKKAVHKTEWGPKSKPSKVVSMGKFTTIGTQPTRAMFGLK